MRIRLRQTDRTTRKQIDVFDTTITLPGERDHELGPVVLKEDSPLSLFVYPAPTDDFGAFNVRLLVGNVVVASSLDHDRADFLFTVPQFDDRDSDYLVCSPRQGQFLLQDWVGQTELKVAALTEGRWREMLIVDLHVAPSKMENDDFQRLCDDIANQSSALLLDVYGKTFVGVEAERQSGETAPLVAIRRLQETLQRLSHAIRLIRHRPAYRLKSRRVREQSLPNQRVSDVMLDEACVDSTCVVRSGANIRFREAVREIADINYDVPENRLIGQFLSFMRVQISDLRSRLNNEIDLRNQRRSSRDWKPADGQKSWWEKEDAPRIIELESLSKGIGGIESDVANLQRRWFVRPGLPLTALPGATPLIRAHHGYNVAFAAIESHYRAFRIQIGDMHLLSRAKSLPVLYEWWCLLSVLTALRSLLLMSDATPGMKGGPFRQLLSDERQRFVIEFSGDQIVDFRDANGRLVRLRYEPCYRPIAESGALGYGLLGDGRQRTPDIAIEVFPDRDALSEPELIIVLDAKYTSVSHERKMDELRSKYGQIGRFASGLVLTRQVWAMTPSAPPRRQPRIPEWSEFCTVDNVAFWSDAFDMQSSVAGAVQAKPVMPGGRSPLELLLRLLLTRSGIVISP